MRSSSTSLRRDPLSRLSAQRARQIAERSRFLRNRLEDGIELGRRRRHARAPQRDPLAHAIEMLGQAALAPPGLRLVLRRLRARQANTDGTAPRLERVENVVLAEIDLHRAAASTFRVIPDETGVDTLTRDFERDALLGPAADALERRSDDSESGGRRSSGKGRLRSRDSTRAVILNRRRRCAVAASAVCFSPTPFSVPAASGRDRHVR